MGASSATRPRQKVAIHANTCTPLGMATMKLAADTTSSERLPRPAVNMWCTHSAKLTTPTPMSASTTARWPTSGVPASVATIIDTMPAAGRKMM